MVEPTPSATSPIHFHRPDFTFFTVVSSLASLPPPSSPVAPPPSWRGGCPEPGAEEKARAWQGRRSAVAAAVKTPEGRCGEGEIEQEVTKRCDGRPRAEAAASRQRRKWLMQVCVANTLEQADTTLFGCGFGCTSSICHHSLLLLLLLLRRRRRPRRAAVSPPRASSRVSGPRWFCNIYYHFSVSFV